MAKSIMGGHNLGSIKSGETGGRTAGSSGGATASAPKSAPPKAAAPTTPAVMGPRPPGVGQAGAMPVPPPMQITPNRIIKS